MAGLTSTGFTSYSLSELVTSMQAKAKELFGSDINIEDDSVMGVLIELYAYGLDQVWSNMQSLYDSFVPQNAVGVQLDNIAQIKGLTRKDATSSTSRILLTGTGDTLIPAGTLFSIGASGSQFSLDSDVTLPGGGTSIGYVTCTVQGPVLVAANSIDKIVTPVTGLSSVTQPDAGAQGSDVETDVELRYRLANIDQILGSSSRSALEAKLLEFSGITSALVSENVTSTTDAEGIPPHSFHAVLWPTITDTAGLAKVIYDNKPAGIQAHGAAGPFGVVGSNGETYNVDFSWATEKAIEIQVTLTTNSAVFPSDGNTQIQTALVNAVAEYQVGQDIKHFNLLCTAADAVEGVEDITLLFRFKDTGSFLTTTLAVAGNEVATLATANCTVGGV